MSRTAAQITVCKSGRTVETWYDRQSRNWVTQTKTPEGNEIAGGSEFSGDQVGARWSHAYRVKCEGGKKEA